MGQPGGGWVPGKAWYIPEGNTYYNKCKTCAENKTMRYGRVGKYPNDRTVNVDDCKHRGSDKSFRANGACCTGYEPGFRKRKKK